MAVTDTESDGTLKLEHSTIVPGNDQDADAEKQDQPDVSSLPSEDGDFGPAPDGGLRAWLVAAGAACTFFAGLGYASSFGVFQEYYATHQLQGESADRIAWIGSLAAFLQLASGLVGGPLSDRLGTWIIRPASVLYIIGVMLTSLCTSYWQLMLAQGVLTGLATGGLMFPAMTAVTQHFDKKRAAALGLAVSGSSLGGIGIPIALSRMLNGSPGLGFGWSVRTVGFVTAVPLAFACVVIKPRLPPRKTRFLLASAWRDPVYVLLVAAMFFMFVGMWTPLFFMPTYAVSRGVDPALASYMLAIINAASTFGRIVPGIMADRWGRINIFGLAGVGTGVVVLCLDRARSTAGLIVYSVVFGFWSGTIISGGSAAFSVCSADPRNYGTYMGMGMAVSSIAALIGPPSNGALIHRYGGFLQSSIFSSIMCLVGGVVALASKALTGKGMLGRT